MRPHTSRTWHRRSGKTAKHKNAFVVVSTSRHAALWRSPGRHALHSLSVCQHVIRHAVAMARLVGVPTPVHVRQVERPNGAQDAAVREELAYRDGAAHIDAEHVRPTWEEITDVLRRGDALLEQGFVHLVRRGGTIFGEIRKMHDESGADVLALGIECKSSIQLALTRISGLSEVDGRQETDQ